MYAPIKGPIRRGSERSQESYLVIEEGVTSEVRIELIDARLGVDGAIRIHDAEYSQIDTHQHYFTHFNLECGGHEIGMRYALPRIMVPGYYRSDEDELPPQLSFESILFGTCVRVKEKVSYNELTPIDFVYSMLNIKDREALEAAIIRRYGTSMPGLSHEELRKLGVAVTTLRLDDQQW